MAIPFTDQDKWKLLQYIEEHKDIIENKKTDINSNQKKSKMWDVIAEKFNSSAEKTRKKSN